MTLRLDEIHQEQLRSLQEIDVETAGEFCSVAFQFLQSGRQPRLIEKAARKLGWEAGKLQQVLEALMELYREAARRNISEEDFKATLNAHGIAPEYAGVIVEFFASVQPEVRSILSRLAFNSVRLKNLEWRLEVEVASRTMHNRFRPTVMLQLELENRSGANFHTLQMDIPTLLHVTEQLEQALLEVKSAHAKKIMRHIK